MTRDELIKACIAAEVWANEGEMDRVLDAAEPIIRADEGNWRQIALDANRIYQLDRDRWAELRATVQLLRDGARREQQRMLNPDGSESLFAAEPRHFADAYDSVLKMIDEANE